ncbi:MAG: tyrosine-type recombinase/integrase [Gammaproteobacteria bacterium]
MPPCPATGNPVVGEPRTVTELRVYFDRQVPDGNGGFEDRGGFWLPVHLWDKARAKAGVKFQFRDLRAKAGTDKAESQDIHAAQKQLGHKTIVMTEHYVRERLGDKVDPTK